MKYTKRMFEVTILDSYRNCGCGRGRSMNPCGTNGGGYPYPGRCVTSRDSMYRNTRMPDCGCEKQPVMPDCGCSNKQAIVDCGCKETPAKSDCGCASVPRKSCKCDCGDRNEHMRHMPVGIGYVPMQKWEEMYDPATALCQGTAFPSLNLIFCGKRG